ncbi:MAG: cytochrome c biogenesis protein ResB [Candidatus Korobacteraceae bacterium]
MAFSLSFIPKRIHKTFANLRTGIVLLILVVIASAMGTFVLQRPATDADKLAQAYSPNTLRWLDRFMLTDVFHSWWFLTLLGLVSLSIVLVSVDRFPNAWRFYARPYRRTDWHFRAALPHKVELPIKNAEDGLNAAERALKKLGWPVDRVAYKNEPSLYSERHRFSVMAVYIVHASLFLIFAGGIIDGAFGYSGFLALHKGQTDNVIELRSGGKKQLPFAVKCYAAGQDNYADGSPKKWWSKLAVVQDGKEIESKEIVVNDPLVYQGLRFYQSSYWLDNRAVDSLQIAWVAKDGKETPLQLKMNQPVALDSDATVSLVDYIPDAFVRDGQVFKKSDDIENPAFGLEVKNRATAQATKVWLVPAQGIVLGGENLNYQFKNPTSAQDIAWAAVTGLEVSHEPGQWLVWTGVLLMSAGLGVAFYMVHMRLWVVAIPDAKGKLVLWVGGQANKNRDRFEQKFNDVVEGIRSELERESVISQPARKEQPELTLAGVK